MSPTSTKPGVVENYSFGVNVHLKRVNTPNWQPCWGFQSLLYFEFKYFSLKTNTLDISNKINKEDKDLYIYFHLWLFTSLQLLSGLICWLDRGGRRGQGLLQFFSSLSDDITSLSPVPGVCSLCSRVGASGWGHGLKVYGGGQYLVQRAQGDASYRHAFLKPSAEYDEISSVPKVPFYEIPAVFFFFLRQVTHTRCISCQRKDKMLPLDTLAAFLLNSWDTRGSKCFWFIENAAIARLLIPYEGTIRYSLIQGASPTSMGWAPLLFFFFFFYTSSFYFTQCALKISINIAFSIQSCMNVQEYQGEAVIVDELWGPIRQHSKDARKTH